MTTIIFNLLTLIFAGSLSFYLFHSFLNKDGVFDFGKRKKRAEELIDEAKNEAESILGSVKKQKEDFETRSEQDFKENQSRLDKIGESLKKREEILARKEEKVKELKLGLASIEEEIQSKKEKCERAERDFIKMLSEKSGQQVEEAKEKVINQYIQELKEESERKAVLEEEDLKESLMKKAQRIVLDVTQRLSFPTSVESRAIYLKVPEDKIKGKLVGRDGKNILKFEELIEDVEILFNDLPNTITIASFNLVKRRLAQKAMEKLIRVRGEIDETVIKRSIEEAEKETDNELLEIGRDAAKRMAIGKDNPELLKIIGRLQYRTSYGQNIMKHSMEVGWAASMLACELGVDANIARVGGFLHDLGKAIDQDPNVKDAHDYISKELMEQYGFSWEEVHAAWTHHDAIPQETAEAFIVKAADAISASRPGARQESLGKYVERMQELEKKALEHRGVEKSYAISAGREVRAFVDPKRVRDQDMQALATEIAKDIEENIAYPGKIKVNVIRKTRYTENIKAKIK